MWSAWFGGYSAPSDYANAEMPEWVNVKATCLVAGFLVPFLAFLIVLPGAREKRLVTLAAVTFVVFVGCSLTVSVYFPSWTVGFARVVVPYKAHTAERVLSQIFVNVGLGHLNISLRFEDVFDSRSSTTDVRELYYNEQFDISSVSAMNEALKCAYTRGLPYPILSVLEYFSLNQDAFDWGRHYRQAGHYANAALMLSLACWVLSVLFLCFLPHCFCYAVIGSGLASLLATVLYATISPAHLAIAFHNQAGHRSDLVMQFGWCFWLVLAIGVICVACGVSLVLAQRLSLYTLSTFLDASLDETVGPSKRRCDEDLSHLTSSVQVMRLQKKSPPPSEHSKQCSTSSSGFESRNSYYPSLRGSLDSFELGRSASDVTMDTDPPSSAAATRPQRGPSSPMRKNELIELSFDNITSESRC